MKVLRLIVVAAILAASSLATPAPALAPGVDRSRNIRELAFFPTNASVKDFAFQGDLLIASLFRYEGDSSGSEVSDGHLDGIVIYKISDGPPYLREISRYYCASGSEGSISVWGDHVLQSIDGITSDTNTHESARCNNTDRSTGKYGMRVIDISDPGRPRQVKFVEVACVSHVHALLPQGGRVYAYGGIMPGNSCNDDDSTPAFQLQVLRFFPKNPKRTRVVSTPDVRPQLGCHDVSVLVPKKRAFCTGSSPSWSILDASDPQNPEVIATRPAPSNPVFADSAVVAATPDGRYIAMAELSGSQASRCDLASSDSLLFYDVKDPRDPREVGRYAPSVVLPAYAQCGPSRLNVLLAKDKSRYIAVVAWRHGGVRVVDFSRPENAVEIGHWQDPASDVFAAYWYNGRIYSAEVEEHEVLRAPGSESRPGIRVLEMEGADRRHFNYFHPRFNPRTQTRDFR